MQNNMNISSNKAKEILIAGAIGDAFGYHVEFKTINQIKSLYGNEGIGLNHINHWTVSDDTQMTLFCLDAIINFLSNQNCKISLNNSIVINKIDLISYIYEAYKNWFTTQTVTYQNNNSTYFDRNYKNNKSLLDYKSLYVKQAPGITCLTALGSNKCGTIEYPINESKGCGGIMRVAPIALLPINIEEIFELGSMQAVITHGHKEGYLSSGFCSVMLHQLATGSNLSNAYETAKKILLQQPNNQFLLSYLQKVEHSFKNKFNNAVDMNTQIGEGWVAEETLGIALYSLYHATSFEDCLYISANHSGDSDSTASVACQLYAAQYGLPDQYKTIQFDIDDAFTFMLKSLDLMYE